jgi:hypothetical protein
MRIKQSFVTLSLRPLIIVTVNKNKKKIKKIMEWYKITFCYLLNLKNILLQNNFVTPLKCLYFIKNIYIF